VRWLLVTANVVPSSAILVTLMMEAIRSSETSILTRVIKRHIPNDGILHSDRRQTSNLTISAMANDDRYMGVHTYFPN
jgi:hypothetical protein